MRLIADWNCCTLLVLFYQLCMFVCSLMILMKLDPQPPMEDRSRFLFCFFSSYFSKCQTNISAFFHFLDTDCYLSKIEIYHIFTALRQRHFSNRLKNVHLICESQYFSTSFHIAKVTHQVCISKSTKMCKNLNGSAFEYWGKIARKKQCVKK